MEENAKRILNRMRRKFNSVGSEEEYNAYRQSRQFKADFKKLVDLDCIDELLKLLDRYAMA